LEEVMARFGELLKAAGAGPEASTTLFAGSEVPERPRDPMDRVKGRAFEALFARLGHRLYDSSLTEDQLRDSVMAELDGLLSGELTQLSAGERQRLVADISADILGLGPIEVFLADPEVSEVMVNADDAIFVERHGRLHLTESRFVSVEHLRKVIERIVAGVGRRIDESSPMVDARLPDGSRINAIIPPLAVDGPMLTIRKFAKESLQVDDLISIGSLSNEAAQFLEACVVGKRNLLVSGGTGSGKTTLLNVLSSYIPDGDRIVTIEDAVELRLQQRHVIRLESRPPNLEGKGAVAIRDLVRNSLRMRPDRIVVGECRGGEALDMLQAMNTGHEGSLTTLHANSPRDAISRLETLVLMAGYDLPMRAIREQVASAIDVVVQLSRLRDGSRRVVSITEVVGMEGDVVTLSDLYRFDFEAGFDHEGRFAGALTPTGLRPTFGEELAWQGIELPLGAVGGLNDEDLRPAKRRR
jgi:pilus assembly protein CpaF